MKDLRTLTREEQEGKAKEKHSNINGHNKKPNQEHTMIKYTFHLEQIHTHLENNISRFKISPLLNITINLIQMDSRFPKPLFPCISLISISLMLIWASLYIPQHIKITVKQV